MYQSCFCQRALKTFTETSTAGLDQFVTSGSSPATCEVVKTPASNETMRNVSEASFTRHRIFLQQTLSIRLVLLSGTYHETPARLRMFRNAVQC